MNSAFGLWLNTEYRIFLLLSTLFLLIDFKNSPLECKEKTLENVDVDSFENHKDNLDADVEILIKVAKEFESNITQGRLSS